MAAMFPFFDTGLQVALAMLVLYGLLAATSLSVKLVEQGAVPGMLGRQVNAWWRIFPLISLALLTYPLGLVALAYLVYLLACLELAPFHGGHRLRYWMGAIAIAAGISFLGWQHPRLAQLLLPCAIAIQVFCCGYRPDPRRLVWLLTLATAAAMYVVTLFPMLPLGPRQNMAWLFYLFVVTALNDIGQFAAGKLFGRHKIAPSISPNKTWQGLAGGILVAQTVSFALGSCLSLAPRPTLAMFALLLAIAGFAGDLMFSAAKRYLRIKDFSTLIPGHGGILDRVDSLVLTAPLLYCLLRHIT